MLFPVYLHEEGVELPQEGTYYILGRDGLYLRKDTGIVRATVKIDEISALREVRREARLNLPPLPHHWVGRIVNFFREVFLEYQSEAIVLIFWHPERKQYLVGAPEQIVSPAAVHDYNKGLRFPGYLMVGSIHSHASMSAYHSGIDRCDEKNFDGFHATIGHVNEIHLGVSSEIAVNGNRFPVLPETFLEGLERVATEKSPQPTEEEAFPLRRRRKKRRFFETLMALPSALREEAPRFRITAPGGKSLHRFPFPPLWLRHVHPMPLVVLLKSDAEHSEAAAAVKEPSPTTVSIPRHDAATHGDEGGGA